MNPVIAYVETSAEGSGPTYTFVAAYAVIGLVAYLGAVAFLLRRRSTGRIRIDRTEITGFALVAAVTWPVVVLFCACYLLVIAVEKVLDRHGGVP